MSQPTPPASRSARAVARQVIEIEAAAVHGLLAQLDGSFDRAVELMKGCTGRIVCTGMGKSGLILKKIAATLSSTGSPALFLHPSDAVHGDLGVIVDQDVVLAASFSGTTEELLRLVNTLQDRAVALVVMTGNPASPLAEAADVHLPVAIDREACPLDLAPTASSTACLAMGDALAMALLEARGFTRDDFSRLHPGGRLGKRLLPVARLMHRDAAVPKVEQGQGLRDAIYEMSKKGLGITAIVDSQERLVGCISDGDLRRLLAADDKPLTHKVEECMQPRPRTISGEELATVALRRMEDKRITSLFVTESDGTLLGIIHLHDLWGLR